MASAEPQAALDTSFVVRYLTNDPPHLAARAAAVIDSQQVLALSTIVVAEA